MELPSIVKLTLMIVFLVAVIVSAGWDIYALTQNKQTVSHMIWQFAQEWPIFPLLLGILLGHLFWRGN